VWETVHTAPLEEKALSGIWRLRLQPDLLVTLTLEFEW
jgi:hypothetical protein